MGISGRIVWAAVLAAQVGMFAAPEAGSRSEEDRTAPRITVYVYNYAKVPAGVLHRARREVVRTYRQAGVEAEWVDYPCIPGVSHKYPACRPDPSRRDWVSIRILPPSMTRSFRLDRWTGGLAGISKEGEFGNWALVCAECAKPLSAGGQYDFGAILGALMAHEIGHLLLATTRHSAFGIMRSRWDLPESNEAAQGQLLFTAAEAQRIRANVRERMRAQETVGITSLHSKK